MSYRFIKGSLVKRSLVRRAPKIMTLHQDQRGAQMLGPQFIIYSRLILIGIEESVYLRVYT
jgi:hypothetical protein